MNLNPVTLSLLFGFMIFIVTYMQAGRFLDWLRWQSIGTRDYIVEKLGLMFIEVTPNQVLGAMIAISVLPGLIVFLVILPQLGPATTFFFIVSLVCWFIPKAIVNHMFQKRMDLFGVQMIDGLGLMANGMKSGLSIVQAIGMVRNEMPKPFSEEMDYVLRQNQLGMSVEDAFQTLAKRVPSEDVNMFVTAVVILKETGGNLAETFETIVFTIRERIKVQQKIGSMMSQNIAQGAIVFSLPFGLVAMFYFSDPEFLMPMFRDPLVGMTVIERTREIGTLRAIGLNRSGVVRLFTVESMLLTMLGCVVGLFIMLGVRWGVNVAGITYVPPNSSAKTALLVDLDVGRVMFTFLLMAVVGTLAAYMPARRAAKKDIIDALGHV